MGHKAKGEQTFEFQFVSCFGKITVDKKCNLSIICFGDISPLDTTTEQSKESEVNAMLHWDDCTSKEEIKLGIIFEQLLNSWYDFQLDKMLDDDDSNN